MPESYILNIVKHHSIRFSSIPIFILLSLMKQCQLISSFQHDSIDKRVRPALSKQACTLTKLPISSPILKKDNHSSNYSQVQIETVATSSSSVRGNQKKSFDKEANAYKLPITGMSSTLSTNWNFLDAENRNFFRRQLINSRHLKKVLSRYKDIPNSGLLHFSPEKHKETNAASGRKTTQSLTSSSLKSNTKLISVLKDQFGKSNNSLSIISNDKLSFKIESNFELPNLKAAYNTKSNKPSARKMDSNISLAQVREKMEDDGAQYDFNPEKQKKKSIGDRFSFVFTNRLIYEKKKCSEVKRHIEMNTDLDKVTPVSLLGSCKYNSINFNSINLPIKQVSNTPRIVIGKVKQGLPIIKAKSILEKNRCAIRNFSVTNYKHDQIKNGLVVPAADARKDLDAPKKKIAKTIKVAHGNSITEHPVQAESDIYEKLVNLSCSEYDNSEFSIYKGSINLHNLKRVIKVQGIYKNRKELEILEKFSSPVGYKREKEKLDSAMHRVFKTVYHPTLKEEFKNSTHIRFKSVSGLFFGVKC